MITWLVLGAASASTFADVPTIEALNHRSAAVVEGTVTATHTEPCALGLCTTYTVSVSEIWRGPPREIVQVTLPGGRAGGLTQRVAGLPLWANGDDVVLFLDEQGRPGWSSLFTVQNPEDPLTRIADRPLADPLGRRRLTSVQELRARVVRAESTQP